MEITLDMGNVSECRIKNASYLEKRLLGQLYLDIIHGKLICYTLEITDADMIRIVYYDQSDDPRTANYNTEIITFTEFVEKMNKFKLEISTSAVHKF